MKGTDCTEAQIQSARDFLHARQAGPIEGLAIDDDRVVSVAFGQMAKLLAWYGALRFTAGRDGTGGTLEEPGPMDTTKGYPKPQPDSSSIPDLKPWLDQAVDLLNLYHSGYCPKDVAKDFLEKCRVNFGNVVDDRTLLQSSSISTEHTWCDLPTDSGYWWHHDGNPDLRPFIYHIQISLTGTPRYFIDFPDSRWCDEVGGKWMKVIEPRAWNAAKGQR